ncbi:MAG: T9SS type A sorting domain-containing protein, partial [Bacteroidota bacterium]
TDVTMPQVSSSSACTGRLRDINQGLPYLETNTRFDIIFDPGFAVELDFTVFDLQEDDLLRVTTGEFNSSGQIINVEYTGTELANTTVQFPANHISISLEAGFELFNEDNIGFDLTWQCIAPMAPEASFSVMVDAPCNDRILLDNTSSSIINSWEWYLDGNLNGLGQSVVFDQMAPGTYDLTLIACNEIGCDTATVEDFVLDPPTDPQCLVSTNELEDVGTIVEVFPNPTRGSLNLRSAQNLDGWQINMYDAQGREIREFSVDRLVAGQNLSIAMEDLASGIYWLRGIDESGTTFFTKRIVRW